MAEAQTKVLGGCLSLVRDWQRKAVPLTRLSRILAFFAAVHLPSAMFSPARCTTASNPSRPDELMLPANGSHWTSEISDFVGRDFGRTRCVTRCPPLLRKVTSADPTRPVEPVTR